MFKIEKTDLYEKTKDSLSEYWNINKDHLKYEFCIHLIQYACGKYYDYKRVNTGDAHTIDALEAYRKTNKTSSKAFQFQRLLFGYRIDLSPTKTNLSSVEANKKDNPFVKDHIIGTSLIGFYIIFKFKDKLRKALEIDPSANPDQEFLELAKNENWFKTICEVAEDFSENELKENLCLWSQCRITKLEHEKDNLVRGWGKLSTEELNSLDDKKKLKIIEDRLNLFHYKKPKKTKEIEVEQYHRYRN